MFALFGAAAWWLAAAALSPLAWRGLLVVGVVYGLLMGVTAMLRIPVRVPSVQWQVPATWLRGRSPLVQTLIWGAALSPGFFTRNPYAVFWFGPLLLAGTHVRGGLVTAAAAGAAHGVARAGGILVAQRRASCSTHFDAAMRALRFRFLDALACLFAASAVARLLLR